jgi:RimJ/RimL family protein N-acetyltransferase
MWAHRSIIAGILSYPFEQIGVNLLCCVMHHSNVRAIRFNEHLGFKRDAVLRHRLGWRQHAVVTSMTKYEYEKVWKNAKIRPVAAATA